MNYKSDSTQLSYLHLLSTKATQNVTYHCRNSVAYYDVTKHTYRRGLKLMTFNDVEITPKGGKLRYEAIIDECKVRLTTEKNQYVTVFKYVIFQYRKDVWAKSVLEYTTDKPSRLPITDIVVRDVGKPDQSFWVEIGAVCFY